MALTSEARSTGLEPVTSGVTGRQRAIQGGPADSKLLESLVLTRRVGRGNASRMLRNAADVLQILGGEQGLLTVREAAELLRVRPCTVYRLVHEGKLAVIRVSHAIRIAAEEIERFVTGGAPSTA